MEQEYSNINLENYDHGFRDGLTMCKYVGPLQLIFHPMIQMTIDV